MDITSGVATSDVHFFPRVMCCVQSQAPEGWGIDNTHYFTFGLLTVMYWFANCGVLQNTPHLSHYITKGEIVCISKSEVSLQTLIQGL